MQNVTSSRMLQKFYIQSSRKISKQRSHLHQNAGYTLLEVLVVVVMIGILAAIASPSWLTYTNQRRVSKANDAVLAALQQAQSEAKKTKRIYSVSFKNEGDIPKIAIYPDKTPPPATSSAWKPLGENMTFKAKQVLLYTNLDTTANKKASANVNYTVPIPNDQPHTITFDYMGTLSDVNFGTAGGKSDQIGIKIAVASPKSVSSTAASDTKSCVIVDTLIGGLRIGKNKNECSGN